MNIRGKDVHISYKGLRQRIRPQEHERDGGGVRDDYLGYDLQSGIRGSSAHHAGSMPVCMWGSGPNMTLPVRVRRAAARRGADAEGGSVSGNLENGAGI